MQAPATTAQVWREATAALAILGWRAAVLPVSAWWQDWTALLTAYWLCTLRTQGTRSWTILTLVTMAFLLGLYLIGNLSITLAWWEHRH